MRRGSAIAPTRDGSSPFSSLANVLHSERVSTIRSLSTSPVCEHPEDSRRDHTTVSADHVAGGELFYYVGTVFAFRTHQSNIQVEPERLLLRWLWLCVLQGESHHLCVKTHTEEPGSKQLAQGFWMTAANNTWRWILGLQRRPWDQTTLALLRFIYLSRTLWL